MDRFDLNWPKTDAIFFTDGWRCRIVWRQKGGIGGTIDNNTQCVQRVAQSLDGAPYLLNALKARGHDRLAAQIESMLDSAPEATPGEAALTPAPRHADAKPVRRPAPEAVAKAPQKAPRKSAGTDIGSWLGNLPGSAEFEPAATRRAKVWLELGAADGKAGAEVLFLKTPAPKGKQEWVLKRTWPDGGKSGDKRKAEYIVAASFRGIAAYLARAGADKAYIEHLFSVCSGVEHEELTAGARAWRSAQGAATH